LLTEAVDELYSPDPAGFTQRRDELAARARLDRQAQAARQLARLRKPTRPAWMVNLLVRSDPAAASRLNALAEQMRAAEGSGDGARCASCPRPGAS
jgi:hypothetical protein